MRISKLQRPKNSGGARLKAPEALTNSSHHLHPKFSLEHLVRTYCLSACTTDEKAAFADKLHELSQLTWQQIAQAPRHGQGSETINRGGIKPTIPPCITEEVTILAFRCIGKAPMVGYRSHDTFYVIWIDRDFSLYDHG